jgi:L-aminopeptidase/D-esterase-like protein
MNEFDDGKITDVGGIRVGHFTDKRRPTGCTVLIFEKDATAGVDVRGSAPGTRETDLLNPINTVQKIQAILLSGGSVYGLDAASGVVRYLAEQDRGVRVGKHIVPIVPAAILFDLNVGDGNVHPDSDSGYQACRSASAKSVDEGSIGAGAGATIGKLFGMQAAMKSGLGTASIRIPDSDIVVGAIVAVNAVGDVYRNGQIIAGARKADGTGFINSMDQLLKGHGVLLDIQTNTTIGVVATNASFDKTKLTKVAQMAHDGLARAINPIHTPLDGDTIFAVSTATSRSKPDSGAVGAIGAEVLSRAVLRAVMTATGLPGLPSFGDIQR